jgi:hypothetical protein
MLKRVVCKDETFRQVNDAMSKLSEITEAHDTPQDGPSPYPNPDEVKRLIEDLETFRKYQMEQNEAAEKERKKYEKTAVVSIAAETPSSVGRKN